MSLFSENWGVWLIVSLVFKKQTTSQTTKQTTPVCSFYAVGLLLQKPPLFLSQRHTSRHTPWTSFLSPVFSSGDKGSHSVVEPCRKTRPRHLASAGCQHLEVAIIGVKIFFLMSRRSRKKSPTDYIWLSKQLAKPDFSERSRLWAFPLFFGTFFGA